MIALTHYPKQPSFDCASCGDPWPCAPARLELAEEYRGDPVGLSYYLGIQLADAIDAARDAGGGPVGKFYDRFLGWVPRDGEGRNAA